MEDVGKEIHRFRKERGYTQKYLADASQTTQSHIANIEKGKVSPRLDTLSRIFEVLNVTLYLSDIEE